MGLLRSDSGLRSFCVSRRKNEYPTIRLVVSTVVLLQIPLFALVLIKISNDTK